MEIRLPFAPHYPSFLISPTAQSSMIQVSGMKHGAPTRRPKFCMANHRYLFISDRPHWVQTQTIRHETVLARAHHRSIQWILLIPYRYGSLCTRVRWRLLPLDHEFTVEQSTSYTSCPCIAEELQADGSMLCFRLSCQTLP